MAIVTAELREATRVELRARQFTWWGDERCPVHKTLANGVEIFDSVVFEDEPGLL